MAGMAYDQPNAETVAAGETKELTWAFTESGTVLIAVTSRAITTPG